MRIIKCVTDIIKGNLHEAREYIEKAYEIKEDQPDVASWYRQMAQEHLAFNLQGHSIVTDIINAQKATAEGSELYAGMMAVYKELHAEMMSEQAEVSAMVSTFK